MFSQRRGMTWGSRTHVILKHVLARRFRYNVVFLGNRGLSFALIVFGTFLLVGCIYIPIPEHGTNWSRKDFRPYIDSNNKSSPIRVRRISRDELIAILGIPEYSTPGRRQIIYRYDTERDVTIWPQCFLAQPGHRDSYAVEFDFDDNGILAGWDMAHEEAHYRGGGVIKSPILSEPDATEKFRPQPHVTPRDTLPDSIPQTEPCTRP